MDISQSVGQCSEISAVLRKFPKCPRMQTESPNYISVAAANEKRRLDLELCAPLLTSAVEDIQASLAKFDSNYFESIESRQNYILLKQEEKRGDDGSCNERVDLLSKLEKYEQSISHKLSSVRLSRAETLRLIHLLHQPERTFTHSKLEPVLKHCIHLDIPAISPGETGAYNRIVEIFTMKNKTDASPI